LTSITARHLLSRELVHRLGDEDAGIGHQDVEPPKLLDGAIHHRRHLGLVGHVRLDGDGPTVGLGHDFGRDPLRASYVYIGNDDVGPFAGQPVADGFTKPLSATGDDGDAILE
jgi:hypothetical protein